MTKFRIRNVIFACLVVVLAGCATQRNVRNAVLQSYATGCSQITSEFTPTLAAYNDVIAEFGLKSKLRGDTGLDPIDRQTIAFTNAQLAKVQKTLNALNNYNAALVRLANSTSASKAGDAARQLVQAGGTLATSIDRNRGGANAAKISAATGLFSEAGALISEAVVQHKIDTTLRDSMLDSEKSVMAAFRGMRIDAQTVEEGPFIGLMDVWFQQNAILKTLPLPKKPVHSLATSQEDKEKADQEYAIKFLKVTIEREELLKALVPAEKTYRLLKTRPITHAVDILSNANSALINYFKTPVTNKSTLELNEKMESFGTDASDAAKAIANLRSAL